MAWQSYRQILTYVASKHQLFSWESPAQEFYGRDLEGCRFLLAGVVIKRTARSFPSTLSPFFYLLRGSSSTQQVVGKDEHTHLGPSKLFLDADIVGFNVSSKFEVVDSVFMTTVNSLGRKRPTR